jgi:hypothetical protein
MRIKGKACHGALLVLVELLIHITDIRHHFHTLFPKEEENDLK